MTLPLLTSTEEAEAFGRVMSPDQHILLDGARQALQRAFNALPKGNYDVLEIKSKLATQIQLYREAQESAPFATMSVLLARKQQEGLRE